MANQWIDQARYWRCGKGLFEFTLNRVFQKKRRREWEFSGAASMALSCAAA
jgi:hypothetical protein